MIATPECLPKINPIRPLACAKATPMQSVCLSMLKKAAALLTVCSLAYAKECDSKVTCSLAYAEKITSKAGCSHVFAGESDSDEDPISSWHQPQSDEQPSSATQHSPSADDAITGGSTSVARPLTDAGSLLCDSEQSDLPHFQLQGSDVDLLQFRSQAQSQSQAQSLVQSPTGSQNLSHGHGESQEQSHRRGPSHVKSQTELQSQVQPQSQAQSKAQSQSQSQSQTHPQAWSQAQSQSHAQSHHPDMHLTGVDSLFLDRLAAVDGAHTPHASSEPPQHAQRAQHAQRHRRPSDAQPSEGLTEPAVGRASAGPNQANNDRTEPNQAMEFTADEGGGDTQMPTNIFSNQEGQGVSVNQQQQENAADPMSERPTLASNLTFWHELQQRSGERQARAASELDGSGGQGAAQRGLQGGQQCGHTRLRYHTKLICQ